MAEIINRENVPSALEHGADIFLKASPLPRLDQIQAQLPVDERPLWIADWAIKNSGKGVRALEKLDPAQQAAKEIHERSTTVVQLFRPEEINLRNDSQMAA